MSQAIKLKRSNVASKVPTTADLELGELAVNTYDGKIYLKTKQGPTETILDLTAGAGDDGTGRPAGDLYAVQVNGGEGKFDAIPVGEEGRVLTAHGTATPTWEPVPVSGGTVRSVDIDPGTTGLTFAGGPITTIGTFNVDGTLAVTNGGTGGITAKEAQQNLLPLQTGFSNNVLTTDGSGNLSWTLPPGVVYTAGEGIGIRNGTEIYSKVADNTGNANRLTLTKGDGTLDTMGAGVAGNVLVSAGPGAAPDWATPLGTVSEIKIVTDPLMGLRISGGDTLVPPQENTTHITTTGTLALSGVLLPKNGGTGGTTVIEGRTNLLPAQSVGTTGRVLQSDGTDVRWAAGIPDPVGKNDNMLVSDGTNAKWIPVDAGGTVTSIDVSGGTTGLTTSGGPVATAGTITLGGTLAVANGGTGGTSASTAFTSLAPTTTKGDMIVHNGVANTSLPIGTTGQFLTVENGLPVWKGGGGVVSSIDVSGGTTGLSFAGGPVTSAGVITAGGVLNVLNGGTGATTATAAFLNLAPNVAGNAGRVLSTTGSSIGWNDLSTLGSVIGILGGTTGLTYSRSVGVITTDGVLSTAHGGTGGNTVVQGRTNLLPAQSAGTNGKVLISNGTDVAWGVSGVGSVTSVGIDSSATGLIFAGGPIVDAGTFTVGGTLNVASGGTGGATAQQGRTNLLPDQASHAGHVLISNGTDVSWSSTVGTGTVTSVDINGGTTGMSFAGGPITSSGIATMSGTLAISNGGTGGTTAQQARNNLLPVQSAGTTAGKVLGSDGTNTSWVTVGTGTVTSVTIDPATTGLTVTNGPITTSGALLLGGTLNLANGGTGGTSAQQARNNILPVQTTHSGQALVTDGTNAYWSDTTGTGTVTSVDVSGGGTGLTFSGGPIIKSGTISMAGTLGITNGGTGATTATAALTALLPAQASKAGQVLSTNGTAAAWLDPSTLALAAGATGELQFKAAGGGFSTVSTLKYAGNVLSVPATTVTGALGVTGATTFTGSVNSNVVALGSTAINASQGNFFSATAAGAATWTITTVPTGAYSLTLRLVNGGVGVQTWPASIRWSGGTAPVLTAGAAKYDIIFLTTMDGGTTFQGTSITNFDA